MSAVGTLHSWHSWCLPCRRVSLPQRAVRCLLPVGARTASSAQVTTRAASSDGEAKVATSDASLPFTMASQRLRDLLETAAWDTEEELKYEVSSYTAEMKLTLFTNLGSILTLTAFLLSWLCGEDPLGGMSLTEHSLDAAMLGAGFAVPLILCSIASRARPVSSKFPVLENLQASQQELVQPIVSDLNPSQLLILSAVSVVPCILFLLPAMHGAMMVLAQIMSADLLQPLGVQLPRIIQREAAILIPAVTSSYMAAWVVTRQLSVKDRQVQAIRDALANAERYFRHATAERMADCSAETAYCSEELNQRSQQASEAFKTVAIIWLLMRRKAAQLGYVLTALNISYYGIIWHETDDLSTPLACALVATTVELMLIQHGVGQRRKRAPPAP